MNYEQIRTKIEAFKFTFIPINVDVLTFVKVTQMIFSYTSNLRLKFSVLTDCLNSKPSLVSEEMEDLCSLSSLQNSGVMMDQGPHL